MDRKDFLRLSLGGLVALTFGCTRSKYERLKQINEGIYAFGELNLAEGQNAALLVHPYFVKLDEEPKYFQNLEEFIPEYDGTLITLESYIKLERTASRIASLGRVRNAVFVPSEIFNPTPQGITWDELTNFLRRFDKSLLKLLGGFYRGENKGCLGVVEYELNSRNLETEVLHEIIFS